MGNPNLYYDEYILAATHETTANTSAPDIAETAHKTPEVKGDWGYPDQRQKVEINRTGGNLDSKT